MFADYSFQLSDILPGVQMLFVAFGTLVLVPLLTGFDPNVTLFTAGLGTLLFQLITRGQVPVFLGASVVFITPIIYGVHTWGIPGTLCGLAATGCLYIVFGLIVQLLGIQVIERLFPPVVTGPIIMIIGLILTPVAGNMAMGKTGNGAVQLISSDIALFVSLASLTVILLISITGKGLFRIIPIVCGIVVGYTVSLFLGIVDFSSVSSAKWLAIPNFIFPEWNLEAILFIVPAAIALMVKHFADIFAIGSITGKNYLQKPGIHRTLMGDGIATGVASFLGGPPNTTCSEVSGAVALTRLYNPGIMTWAAIAAILLAFVGKVGAVLQTIPVPVMGGIMLLLFGAIIVIGMHHLMTVGQELMAIRNLVIVALIMAVGISGLSLSIGNLSINGIGFAGILGVILNLALPHSIDKHAIGILVYGSILCDPGKEIKQHIQKIIPTITPFKVEYARKSKIRFNAPVLVPVEQNGTHVNAQIIILKQDVTEEMARDFLYRRAINFVDEPAIVYSDKDKHENMSLEIKSLNDFQNVKKVLYTAFKPNIDMVNNPQISPDEKAKELAYLAIESVNQNTFCMQRDGIRCLIENKAAGVQTPLCDAYTREILHRASGARDLNEARLRIAKQKGIYPESHQ
ncbi:MAG: uracil-xanthine permease [Candidatus Magnetomorum sp.]|nr:uracil-xanthine permease [Candidatus Magnetomorum sp.]